MDDSPNGQQPAADEPPVIPAIQAEVQFVGVPTHLQIERVGAGAIEQIVLLMRGPNNATALFFNLDEAIELANSLLEKAGVEGDTLPIIRQPLSADEVATAQRLLDTLEEEPEA